MKLSDIDRILLDIIQAEFPLSRDPFADLGRNIGTGDTEAVQQIERLKNAGVIRMIGPVFNPRMLGYQTTLVAMKVRPDHLDEAAEVIAAHPLVSHCYLRDHDFNFWFTLALPIKDDMDNEVLKLDSMLRADATVNLPAIKMFKIGAYFRVGAGKNQAPKRGRYPISTPDRHVSLSPTDRQVINELQQDLPLTLQPYDFMSNPLSMNVDEFLGLCHSLIKRGIMRRYSASVNHNSIGLAANAMTCWQVHTDSIEKAGKKIAEFPEVSHCYQRRTGTLWPYNLFAMIHADTKENCQALVHQISLKAGLNQTNSVMLFSAKELKKTRIRYQV